MDYKATRPFARSAAKRMRVNAAARAQLAVYGDTLTTTSRPEALNRLLWAEAFIQQALWQETSGLAGSEYATANSVAAQHCLTVA